MKTTTVKNILLPVISISIIVMLAASSSFAQGGNGNGQGRGNGQNQEMQNSQNNQQNNRGSAAQGGNGNGQGRGNGKNQEMQNSQNNQQNNRGSAIIDATLEISDLELIALEKMGEEEFLARDVYITLYEKWDIKSFSNISKSEQRHADKIIDLTNAYSLDNFSDHEIGIFHDEELQKLYTDLVAKGSISEIEALTVGAIIEDLDIYDLETFLVDVKNPEIQKVFDNLSKGSRNHMRSFISQLEKRGATYSPIYITEERFNDVINGDQEKGGDHGDRECDHDDNDKEEKKGNGEKNQEMKKSQKIETDTSDEGFFAWLWNSIF